MTDFNLDAMESFVRTTDAARASYQPRPCESCGQQSGKPYIIHCAKSTDTSTIGGGQSQTTITTFKDVNALTVSLCEDCVSEHHSQQQRKYLRYIGLGAPFVIVGGLGVLLGWLGVAEVFGVVAILGGILILGSVIMLAELRNTNRVGRLKAYTMYEPKLKQQGFDQIWSNLDIESMRSQLRSQ